MTLTSLVGGGYPDQAMQDTTADELREFMAVNFEANFCRSCHLSLISLLYTYLLI